MLPLTILLTWTALSYIEVVMDFSIGQAALDLALDAWETDNLFTGVLICGPESNGAPYVVWAQRVRWKLEWVMKGPAFPVDRQPYEIAINKLRNDAKGDEKAMFRISPPKHTLPVITPEGDLETVVYCRFIEVPLSGHKPTPAYSGLEAEFGKPGGV